MSAFIASVVSSLVAGGIMAYVSPIVAKRFRRQKSQRLWQIDNPHRARIAISKSVRTDTGEYQRPSTGVGQARALALISPSLQDAYGGRVDYDYVGFGDELIGSGELQHDVILLGGPKNNKATERMLELAREHNYPFDQVPEAACDNIWWNDLHRGGEPRSFCARSDDNSELTYDYGLIARFRNPHSPEGGGSVVLFSGTHSPGTYGAAKYFVSRPDGFWPRSDFAAVVRVEVTKRTIVPTQLEKAARLEAGRWVSGLAQS